MLNPERTTRKTWLRVIHHLYFFRTFGETVALPASSGAMTCPALRTAVAGLGHLAVGSDAGLGVQAPEKAVITGGHRRIGLGQNELSFPAQVGTQIGEAGIETLRLLDHDAPPVAFKIARATATFVSFTL